MVEPLRSERLRTHDHSNSDLFESSPEQRQLSEALNDTHRTYHSTGSYGVFRDPELEDWDATSLKRIQSLASVINDPKARGAYNRAFAFFKGGKGDYDPHMTENKVKPSAVLPKIKVSDFDAYI